MTFTLSDEQYKNLCTNFNKLLDKLHKALKDREEYKKQRDELIGDIAKLRERNEELEDMWRTLKNELLGRYEFYRFRLNELQLESNANKSVAINMGAKINASAILYRMDKLDGTNEFNEFLDRLEDDTNE
ncbi:TPA: acetyltransferase [Staphylococcus aureus]|uniref:hypothetical protein n=3 Tax=Staphylococcus aureus TaxID=1280 RepID=UPI00044FC1E2|nr:hypothetical protein [Staphylococcus aureus]EUQ37616.1 phage protein [Staphylococcus aureus SJOS6106]EUQ38382.1 phage protein [Staphylococcus aureus PLAC6024]EUQ62816.1 phage protein [Staphylococcus aureus WAMC6003]EUQ79072.1 phage protein [Staphylococcus aureus OCMM6047]EVC23801.1 phage protein [Staphylococcus aureus SJOS6071]